MWDTSTNKEAFFLRHTARLPSSTSQLVLFHHLFCIHFQGVLLYVHFQGVLFHVHFQGGPLPCPLLGGYSSMSTSGGVLFHVHSGGSHGTYPIMLLYTTIECPSASWAKFTWDPLGVEQTDRQTRVKTTFPHYVAGGKKYHSINLWVISHTSLILSK